MTETLLLTGAPAAKVLAEQIGQAMAALTARGITPGLGILQIGAAPDDMAYERMALKKCAQFGLNAKVTELAPDCPLEPFAAAFDSLNRDPAIDGILILGAFPGEAHRDHVQRTIALRKDVDAIGHQAIAMLYSGAKNAVAPCTVEAVLTLLDHYGLQVRGKRVCVLGRSLVIGRPLALALVNRSATVQICHSATQGLAAETARADFVFSAIGRAKGLGAAHLREGAVLVDVGINYDENGRLCGDGDPEQLTGRCAALTPVPGGVGAVTNTVLIKHIIDSAMMR